MEEPIKEEPIKEEPTLEDSVEKENEDQTKNITSEGEAIVDKDSGDEQSGDEDIVGEDIVGEDIEGEDIEGEEADLDSKEDQEISDGEVDDAESTDDSKPPQNPPPSEEDMRLPWLVDDFEGITENIYEAVIVASRRARQIGRLQKQEIEALNSTVDVIDLINNENEDGLEPGVDHFHHMKPTVQAMKELKLRSFNFSYPEDDIDEDEELEV